MQFSDTTNKSGLIQDCELLLGLDDAGISGNTTRLKQFTHLINQAFYKVIAWILEADSTWQWDDSNYSARPRGTRNLVNNTAEYTLPLLISTGETSQNLTIEAIAILDTNANEVRLKHTTVSDAELNAQYTTAGRPQYYKVSGDKIKLWPKVDSAQVTTTNGLILYGQRSMTEFLSTDTTPKPGLPAPFHRLISIEASFDWATIKNMVSAAGLKLKRDELKESLTRFFARRHEEVRPRVRPKLTSSE